MGVIIDEFEVVVDSQQDREANNNQNKQAGVAGNSLKPHDINSIHEQYLKRCERVRAH